MNDQDCERLREAAQNVTEAHPAFWQKHITILKEVLDDIKNPPSDDTDKEKPQDA